MRKILSLVVLLISMTTFLYAQDIAKGTAAVHQDAVSATSAIHNDLVQSTSALHKDAVDGISTLHQDLTQAVPAVYSDSKGVIKTLYEDGTRAINYLVPKVESVIQALAQGLKTTTAEVWRILVYKQVALAISYTIYSVIALLLIIVYVIGMKRIVKATTAMNNYWNGGQTAFGVLGGILSLLALGLIAVSIPIMVNGYVIPEAGALKEATALTQQLLQTFK